MFVCVRQEIIKFSLINSSIRRCGCRITEPGIYTINFSDTLCNYRGSFLLGFVADPYTEIQDTQICIGQVYPLTALQQNQNDTYSPYRTTDTIIKPRKPVFE